MHDLRTLTDTVAVLVAGIGDDQLDDPTPCTAYSLGDLLNHVDGLALAFAQAARKETVPGVAPPVGDVANLPDDWRTRIPERLADLAQAWQDPAAWTGSTSAGGLEMDAETAGNVAINEVVIHGWDIARAIGRDHTVDAEGTARARAFVEQFSGPGSEEMRGGIFGPEVEPLHDAGPLEQLVAMTGRDPRWRP